MHCMWQSITLRQGCFPLFLWCLVHAYCWNTHVLQAHQPSYEIGTVNLDGEFTARESKVEEQASGAQASEEPRPEEPNSEEQNSEEQNSEEETTPLLE